VSGTGSGRAAAGRILKKKFLFPQSTGREKKKKINRTLISHYWTSKEQKKERRGISLIDKSLIETKTFFKEGP